jgi:hypothetical protein
MLIILIPVAIAIAVGWVAWTLYDTFSAVPRRNDDFGSF